jgi:hypothetical protein
MSGGEDSMPDEPVQTWLRGAEPTAPAPRSGAWPRSRPCEALSQHGFFGIEPQVVDAAARWIRAH